jgi:hypothetical protein
MKAILTITALALSLNTFATKTYVGKNSKCIMTLNEGISKQLKSSEEYADFIENSSDGFQIEITETYVSTYKAMIAKKGEAKPVKKPEVKPTEKPVMSTTGKKPVKPGSKPALRTRITHIGMVTSAAGVVEFKGLYAIAKGKKGSFCKQIRLETRLVK